MDMRRSDVVEAIAGGADAVDQLTCRPACELHPIKRASQDLRAGRDRGGSQIEAVRKADVSRLQGRRKMRAANRKSAKI
jgi:hypothetical protein